MEGRNRVWWLEILGAAILSEVNDSAFWLPGSPTRNLAHTFMLVYLPVRHPLANNKGILGFRHSRKRLPRLLHFRASILQTTITRFHQFRTAITGKNIYVAKLNLTWS